MSLTEHLFLALAAALGGALNSVAGGGSFLTFPALVLAGVPPVAANATSCIALWPGSVASAVAYRGELAASRRVLAPLGVASVAGGLAGAVLLLRTSDATFARLVPYLLLVAALVFTFGGRVTDRFRGAPTHVGRVGGIAAQLLIALYGGYFGGGMGIVMLATFTAMGMTHIHQMNALKTVLAVLINFVAVVAFLVASAVDFRAGGPMILAGVLGGWYGASVARKIPPAHVRRFVLGVAWSLTAYFFLRGR